MNEIVEISGLQIRVLKKRNLKNLYIRINPPEGDVTVSAPVGFPDEEIKLFVLRKLPEIMKVRNKMNVQPRQSKREYVSGESCYLWGKPYRLQIIPGEKKYSIEKTPNKIIMTVPVGATAAGKEQALTEWYRAELKRVLGTVFDACTKKTGIDADEVKIKKMKTRWGTCNTHNRRIWINLQLVKKPPECLEYVVIHELVHLLEKNHTNRFNALVEEYCPTWKEARKLLTEMPLDYTEAGGEFVDEE
jgi:predicted metal-dependent hydrolase